MENKDLESRRSFFKKAAKSALPILGAIALTHVPFASRAAQTNHSSTGCNGECYGGCSGSCDTQCWRSCYGDCYGECRSTCSGTCDGDCSGSCKYSCAYTSS